MSSRLVSFFFLFIFFNPAFSQQIENTDFLSRNFFSHSTESGNLPKWVEGKEDSEILDYSERNSKFYDPSKVETSKIKNVFISYHSNDSLTKEINELKIFPNLEFLEIKTRLLFKNKNIPELILPLEFTEFKKLKYLQISGSFEINYKQLFEILKKLPQLKYLGIGHGQKIIEIPPTINELKSLEGLKLLGFKKISFPDEVNRMEALQSLFLETSEGKEGVDISSISKFPNIKKLVLFYAKLNQNSIEVIDELDQLEAFVLVNSELENPEILIEALPSELQEIKLRNFKTRTGRLSFEKFTALESIELQTNITYQLAPFDYRMEKLRSLTIHSDSLKSIKVGSLPNLQTLNLAYSGLTEFPEGVNELHQLENLQLQQNLITEIPKKIKALKNLEELNLANNKIRKIAPEISKLKKLKILDLAFNYLTFLPTEFTSLKELQNLNLKANKLQSIPSDIGNLENLVEFNLGDNYIESLPGSITQLKKLSDLDLSYNKLETLPQSFGNLQALETLILGGNRGQKMSHYSIKKDSEFTKDRERAFNQIKTLPKSFAELKNIKRLYFQDLNTLDSENLFQTLFGLPSKKYRVQISGVGINFLPFSGWENFLGETLEMGGSVIDSIPKNILKAPYLEKISFKLDEEDGLAYSFNSRSDFLVFAEEQGYIDFQEIERSEKMAEAYLDYAYGKKYKKNQDNILEIFNKAFLVDSAYTSNHIRASEYAKALSNNGENQKAVLYYNKAIEKDTLRGPYILNFIIPHFKERAQAQLKIGDSLAALEGLQYFSGRFDKSSWSSTALLAKRMNKDSLTEQYFKNAVEYYQEKIQFSKKENKENFLEQLSLLELYFISEDFEAAALYLSELKKLDFKNNDELVLMKFFGIVNSIVQKSPDKNSLGLFSEYKKKHQTYLENWSFELFKEWLTLTETLCSKDKNLIRSLLSKI